jgi:hypothetical protein
MEISDTKLNNFHGLKVTSNAQKKQIQLVLQNKSLITEIVIKREQH